MSKTKLTFYPNNSQFVQITGLQDQVPNIFINNASITGTLKDSSGNAVAGATNLAGVYVAGSNGDYTFAVDPSTFNPAVGYDYVFVIDGTYGGNRKIHAEIPAFVVIRNQGTEQ